MRKGIGLMLTKGTNKDYNSQQNLSICLVILLQNILLSVIKITILIVISDLRICLVILL